MAATEYRTCQFLSQFLCCKFEKLFYKSISKSTQNTIQKLSFGNKLKKRCSNGCPGLFPIFSHAQFPRHFKPNLHQSLALPKPKIGQGNAYSCQNHGSHGVALATRRFPCFGLRRRLSQLASLGG